MGQSQKINRACHIMQDGYVCRSWSQKYQCPCHQTRTRSQPTRKTMGLPWDKNETSIGQGQSIQEDNQDIHGIGKRHTSDKSEASMGRNETSIAHERDLYEERTRHAWHSRKIRMGQGRDFNGEQEVYGTGPGHRWDRSTPSMCQVHFIQWTGTGRSGQRIKTCMQ